MKKAIVFDLDGTLINSLPDIAAAMNRALVQAGVAPHPEESYKNFVGDGVFNLTKRALGEQAAQHWEAVCASYSAYYAAHSRVGTAPYPGIHDMLRSLRGTALKLCVLSNKDDSDTRQVITHYFPDIPFADMQGRLDGFPIKPDPTTLLMMADRLSIAPGDFWYVGDSVTDMRCAKAAGMASIAVLWGFQSQQALATQEPEHFAHTVQQLEGLLLT